MYTAMSDDPDVIRFRFSDDDRAGHYAKPVVSVLQWAKVRKQNTHHLRESQSGLT